MTDEATGGCWLALTGERLAGKLKGQRLARPPATPWPVERWRGLYPDGAVYRRWN